MDIVGIPKLSEQAKEYARAVSEAFSKASEAQRAATLAAMEPTKLPDAEREKFWGLAYDSMLKLEAQASKTRLMVGEEQITAEAFWWGWHLNVPHNQVENLINGIEGIAAIIELGLHVVPEVGEIIALAIEAWVLVYKNIIRLTDKGNGIYLSQSWLLIGIASFIPTPR